MSSRTNRRRLARHLAGALAIFSVAAPVATAMPISDSSHLRGHAAAQVARTPAPTTSFVLADRAKADAPTAPSLVLADRAKPAVPVSSSRVLADRAKPGVPVSS